MPQPRSHSCGEPRVRTPRSHGEKGDGYAVQCCVKGIFLEIAIINRIIPYHLKRRVSVGASPSPPLPHATCALPTPTRARLGPPGHVWAEGHLHLALDSYDPLSLIPFQNSKYFHKDRPICYLSGLFLKN